MTNKRQSEVLDFVEIMKDIDKGLVNQKDLFDNNRKLTLEFDNHEVTFKQKSNNIGEKSD